MSTASTTGGGLRLLAVRLRAAAARRRRRPAAYAPRLSRLQVKRGAPRGDSQARRFKFPESSLGVLSPLPVLASLRPPSRLLEVSSLVLSRNSIYVACSSHRMLLFSRSALFATAVLSVSGTATPWNCNATAPRQVHLALTEALDGMLFSWSTGTPIWAVNETCPPQPNATSPAVRYGTAPGDYGAPVASNYSLQYLGLGDVLHRVNVSGLSPRTRYYYTVGDLILNQWSPEFSFFSRPPVGGEEVVDYIAYGDMGFFNGTATLVQAAIAAELASPQSRNYSFTTHIGDISYSGLESQNDRIKDTQLWDLFMDEIAPISSRMPYMVAPGCVFESTRA